jgi:hypothetical protein
MISITSREVTTLLKFFDKALRRPRQRLLGPAAGDHHQLKGITMENNKY